jgi:glyoxylase-like metal-dependent hydrolase (beta-lactamase superfamily II)
MASARQISNGVFVLRYEASDLNVCVVRGEDGLLVVDTGSSPAEAAEIEADVQLLGAGPLLGVINTHAHFDHTFGNQHFGPGSELDCPIYGHHLLPAHLEKYERPRLEAWLSGTGNEPARDWDQVLITPPTHLVTARQRINVGGRPIELVPMGRGHTDTDLAVYVPDAATWIVGDLIEESGPPMYGSGCFPMDWPSTVAGLLTEIGSSDIVIPGHGLPVTREFVVSQLADLAAVADRARALFASGASVDDALAEPGWWPFPVEGLRIAVERAFASLELAT